MIETQKWKSSFCWKISEIYRYNLHQHRDVSRQQGNVSRQQGDASRQQGDEENLNENDTTDRGEYPFFYPVEEKKNEEYKVTIEGLVVPFENLS